jgi:hypothetical protein
MMDFTPGTLIAGLVVSSVGLGLFLYGKKQGRVPQLVAGILLTVVAILVPGPWLMSAVAAVLVAGTWFATQRGW